MCVLSYYKLGNNWFLDLPDYLEKPGAYADDLECIGSFHDFLEWLASGREAIRLQISTERFDGAEVLVLTGDTGDQSGGYYYIGTFDQTTVDLELWVNRVIYFFVDKLPEHLFVKPLPS